MQYNQELILKLNNKNSREALIAFPLFFIFAFFSYLLIGQALNNQFSYVLLFLQKFLVFAMIMFLLLFIAIFLLTKNEKPVAILNQNGFWVKQFGVVPWSNIESVDFYTAPGTPMEGIGVRIRNTEELSRQATASGKISIFFSKLFGHPQITLCGLDTENYTIIRFAQQFLDQKESEK